MVCSEAPETEMNLLMTIAIAGNLDWRMVRGRYAWCSRSA